MNKLQGKVAIITGGASGIGEATALLFAEHGARVVIADVQDEKGQKLAGTIADVQDEKGQKLARTIGTQTATYIHCDVTNESQVKSLVESTIQLYGCPDIMFCNAGILNSKQDILDFNLDAYEKLFAINVRGVTASVKHAARAMVEAGKKGTIICTASVAPRSGGTRGIDYVMSKCAVLGLMKCASIQLGEHGIRVNCVSPGPVATPLMCNGFGMGVEEVEKSFASKCYLNGKGVLKQKNVADAVLFLACEDSEFITGHDLAVDAGFIAL